MGFSIADAAFLADVVAVVPCTRSIVVVAVKVVDPRVVVVVIRQFGAITDTRRWYSARQHLTGHWLHVMEQFSQLGFTVRRVYPFAVCIGFVDDSRAVSLPRHEVVGGVEAGKGKLHDFLRFHPTAIVELEPLQMYDLKGLFRKQNGLMIHHQLNLRIPII